MFLPLLLLEGPYVKVLQSPPSQKNATALSIQLMLLDPRPAKPSSYCYWSYQKQNLEEDSLKDETQGDRLPAELRSHSARERQGMLMVDGAYKQRTTWTKSEFFEHDSNTAWFSTYLVGTVYRVACSMV